MDSEVTNLAAVKGFDPTDYATAAQGTLAASATQPGDNVTTLSSGAATNGQVPVADGAGNISWADQSGAGGATNLTWTASTRTIASSTGTNAVITLATTDDAGLMSAAQFDKLAGLATDPVGDHIGPDTITPTTWGSATDVSDKEGTSGGDSSSTVADYGYYSYTPVSSGNAVLYLPSGSSGDRLRIRVVNSNSVTSGTLTIVDAGSPYTVRSTAATNTDTVFVLTHDGTNWSEDHTETPTDKELRPDASGGKSQSCTLSGGDDNVLAVPTNLADGESMVIAIEQAGTAGTLSLSDSYGVMGGDGAADMPTTEAHAMWATILRTGNIYRIALNAQTA